MVRVLWCSSRKLDKDLTAGVFYIEEIRVVIFTIFGRHIKTDCVLAWRVLFAYKRVIRRRHCVEVTACKSSHGQESYLRVLNVFLLAKNIANKKKNKRKILFHNLLFLKGNIMNCGDIEKNRGVLDQCYRNNNFVTNAVLGVRNSNLLLKTRFREFKGIAVDVGGVRDGDFECVTKMDDISILLISSDNQ